MNTNRTSKIERSIWDVWRDFTCGTTRSWRMKTPIGVLSFKTKKEAEAAHSLYEKQKEDRIYAENKTSSDNAGDMDGMVDSSRTNSSKIGLEDAKCRCGIRRPMHYTCGSCGVMMNARYFEKIKSDEDEKARIRLFAAAPDMLAALKSTNTWFHGDSKNGVAVKVRAAIAKAEAH